MSQSAMPNLPCMGSSVRRASRALTQRYEEALRPLRLRATQFTILQVLSLAGEVRQGRLGEMLAMDSTSLTRTLAIMQRRGWVADRRGGDRQRKDRHGEDRRQRWLRLAKPGRTQLDRALPVWEKVQSQLRRELGDQRWNALFQLTNQVTEFATRQHKETL